MKLINLTLKDKRLDCLTGCVEIDFSGRNEVFEEIDLCEFYNGIVNLLNNTLGTDIFDLQSDFYNMPIILSLKRENEKMYIFKRNVYDEKVKDIYHNKYLVEKESVLLFVKELKNSIIKRLSDYYSNQEIQNYYLKNFEELI